MFKELERVAGYVPPTELSEPFSTLQQRLAHGLPDCLTHLHSHRSERVDWLRRFRSSVLGSLQEGVYASSYHLSRIQSIESEMLQIAEQFLPQLGKPVTSSGMGGGNSRALNFEYQAFAFALRRTLEYLAVAVASFFKSDCHSIRSLYRNLDGATPVDRALQIRAVLAEHMPALQDVIPFDKDTRRSLRDRLAHWEAIPAGTFNVSRGPWGASIGLVGGGHNLRHPMTTEPDPAFAELLSPVLRDQLERIHALIWLCMDRLGLKEAV
jgi:hypothetical protein